jgi:hypothetical protein
MEKLRRSRDVEKIGEVEDPALPAVAGEAER